MRGVECRQRWWWSRWIHGAGRRYSKWGEQPPERVETLLASHHFLLTLNHTPPPLVLLDLSMWSTENESQTELQHGAGQPCLSKAQNNTISCVLLVSNSMCVCTYLYVYVWREVAKEDILQVLTLTFTLHCKMLCFSWTLASYTYLYLVDDIAR